MTKKLEDYTRDELIDAIRLLKKRKKFGLVWEDKPEKVVQNCQESLPVLEEVRAKTIKKTDGPTHLIIEGDNYHSLSALNYTHTGKIDLIYIDPPYNTGNQDFIYNDTYVDKEDSFRHSKWLSFMGKRLQLAKSLLNKRTGLIFVSIGEDEYAELKMLMDHVFTEENYIGDAIWQSRRSVSNDTIMSLNHNHTLIFAMDKNQILALAKKGMMFRIKMDESKFSNPDNDPRGVWTADPFDAPQVRTNLEYEITNPNTGQVFLPPNGRHWRTTRTEYERYLADNRIIFGKTGRSKPQLKRFFSEVESKGTSITSMWTDVGTTTNGSNELKAIFGDIPFNNPKPTTLIQRVMEAGLLSNKGIVLDFFAGSGTTGHAVLKQNMIDGGKRQFIICTNNENDVLKNITYPRIQKVIEGYGLTSGIPANVRYFKTEFVSKKKTDDQTRLALVDRCTDMIRIRENTFESVIDDEKFKLFEGDDHYSAIIFDPQKISEFIKKIEDNDKTKPVSVYIFSYSNYAYDEDIPETELDYVTCPIPESILEVYKRIFEVEDRLNV